MILSSPIDTPRTLLRTLEPSDVGSRYLAWLSDPNVTRFLEIRFSPVCSTEELMSFVNSANASADSLLLGIFLREGRRHIGNIKLGPVQIAHKRAEIGFLIGEKDCWGQGYAAEAIAALSRYGHDCLGLGKIKAGCYETNVGSAKALLKAGFTHEATISSDVICDGKRVASWLFGFNRPTPDIRG
jgi:[ribosomal protein S5]-alanine N-acetyltransferase